MKKGYTLTEILLTLIIMSTLLALSVPMMTQKIKSDNAEISELSACINIADTDIDVQVHSITGNIVSTNCQTTVNKIMFSLDNTLEHTIAYADGGSLDTNARHVIKAACDLGSEPACQYLVNKCIADPPLDEDDTTHGCDGSDYFHLAYYIESVPSDTPSEGYSVILDIAKNYYDSGINTLFNDYIDRECTTDTDRNACIVNGQ